MSATARPSLLKPLAGLLALATLGVGGYLLLRTSPAPAPAPPPAPVAKPAPAPPPAPAPEPPPPPAPKGTESVAGRVLQGEEGETALAGAAVEVFEGEGDPVPFLAPIAKGESGADGAFRVGGLAKDHGYRVRASKEGSAAATGTAVGGGGPVDLRLLPGMAAAGTVKDADTKDPIAGARVVGGDAVGTTTGPDGSWRLEGLPNRGAAVTASAKGYLPRTRNVREKAKDRESVALLLAGATTASGVVLGADGKPAADVTVVAHVYTTAPVIGRMETESQQAKSGKDGTFTIEAIPYGKALAVTASSPEGFAPAVEAGPLKKGEAAAGLELRIAPGATLVVTVLDEAGQPVPGAAVHASPVAEKGQEDSPMVARAVFEGMGRKGDGPVTDAAGVTRIRPVTAGKTAVNARKEDFLPAKETVEAVAGAETPVALRLAAGVAITGKVVDEAGNPVPAAEISATRFARGDYVQESRKTAEDGSFRIGGLEGKGFGLQATKAGFVPAEVAKVDPAAGPVTVTLSHGGTIAGVAVDEEGKPIAAFSVATKRTDVKTKSSPFDISFGDGGTAFKDPEGRFKVEGLAPGTWTVTATAAGLAPGRVADVAVTSGATTEVRVVVPVGLALRGIVVRKGAETPVEGASVSIAKGGPFGDMDIDIEGLMGAGDEGGDAEEVAAMRESLASSFGGGAGAVVTDAEGRFVLKGLEAGNVNVRVKAKDLAPATRKGIEVPSDEEVRILVSEGAAIEGTVYDAQKAPKEGATVMLQKLPLTMKMARTDARGHYRIAGIAPGKYLFYAMEEGAGFPGLGGGMKSESVTLEEGRTLVKDHRFGEGTKLTGKVTRGGKPVEGTMVVLLPGAGRKDAAPAMLGGSGFAMATTKEDGSYEIPGIAPGVYTAMVQTGMGGGPAPGDPIEIPAGAAEVKRDIALARNAVRGVVVDGGGEPVEGVRVHAIATGKSVTRAADLGEAVSSMGGEAVSGPDGRFEMEDMNAGSFTLRAEDGGKGSAVVENVAPSEEGTEVRLVLVKGVELAVRVLDADGKPVAGASVYLSDAKGNDLSDHEMFGEERTGEDGRLVLTVAPGTVHIEAVASGHAPATVSATAGQAAEVAITLPRGASIEVLVTDAGGNPREGATVRILDASGNAYSPRLTVEGIGDLLSSPATGSDGKYLRGDLPAGTWTVRAAAGERTADAAVTVAAGERKSVTVRLP